MQSYSFVVVLLANLAANEPAVKIETPIANALWDFRTSVPNQVESHRPLAER